MNNRTVNKVLLLGAIASSLSLFEEDGLEGCNFALAINDKDRTNFYRIKTTGLLAKVVCEYLKKGDNVLIEGKLIDGFIEAENINFIKPTTSGQVKSKPLDKVSPEN